MMEKDIESIKEQLEALFRSRPKIPVPFEPKKKKEEHTVAVQTSVIENRVVSSQTSGESEEQPRSNKTE